MSLSFYIYCGNVDNSLPQDYYTHINLALLACHAYKFTTHSNLTLLACHACSLVLHRGQTFLTFQGNPECDPFT